MVDSSGRACEGLLRVAEGDGAGAVELLRQALVDHERLPMPFEAARTRLLLGSALRRTGHRSAARQELEAARTEFERLATPGYAEQARLELASIGGWHSPEGALTPVEARVAALVADGRTNREVAGLLFLSVRTVEGHLGHIYRKLGVRSRSELARLWVEIA